MNSYRMPRSFLDPNTWQSTATTPNHISPLIEQVCGELEPGSGPIMLAVTPIPGASLGYCYQNVADAGLPAQHGWLLWELAGVFVCAEHHCVGLVPAGTFVDVTPQVHGERRVLFLPGKDRSQEIPVPNQFWPCGDHPLLQTFVRLKVDADRLVRAGHIAEFKLVDAEIMRTLRAYQRLQAKWLENANRKERRRQRKKKRSH